MALDAGSRPLVAAAAAAQLLPPRAMAASLCTSASFVRARHAPRRAPALGRTLAALLMLLVAAPAAVHADGTLSDYPARCVLRRIRRSAAAGLFVSMPSRRGLRPCYVASRARPPAPARASYAVTQWYQASTFDAAKQTWPDSAPGGRVTGQVSGCTLKTAGPNANGTTATFPAVTGSTTSSISFNYSISTPPYSICAVMRYTTNVSATGALLWWGNAGGNHWLGGWVNNPGPTYFGADQWATLISGSVDGNALAPAPHRRGRTGSRCAAPLAARCRRRCS
jgi:hypothetical protein